MGDLYGRVQAKEEVEGLKQRAKMIVEMELLYTERHKFYRYMHVAEAFEGASVPDGDTGSVIVQVKRDVDRLRADMSHEVNAMKHQVMQEVADVKQLLQQLLEEQRRGR